MPAWLNRTLTNRILSKHKKGKPVSNETVIMRIGDTVGLPCDVDVYVFEDSDKARAYAAGIEYPEELDSAVKSGIAMKGNAKNLLDAVPPQAFVWLASNM